MLSGTQTFHETLVLLGWVGSGFLDRSSLMLVGAAEWVSSEVIAWLALDKAP